MVPDRVRAIDTDEKKEALATKVQQLSVADIESMSIADISSLKNRVLKDLLNDAIRSRLASHLGGTYTSAPKMSLGELSSKSKSGA